MIELIPSEVLKIYNKLISSQYEAYLVGGCVRNILLKKPVKDWDITTNAAPEQMLNIFPDGFYDNKFGTVGIPTTVNGKDQIVEVTTFRTEHGSKDRRHPEKVEWGKSVEEDLARRDFTIDR